jgi:outer membrane immunogenic protein
VINVRWGFRMRKILMTAVAIAAMTGGAQSADLGVARGPVAAAIVAPVFGWSGFYLGLNAGVGFANTNWAALTGGILPGSAAGFVGGAQIGYNYQINNFVLGAEADFGYIGVSRSATAFGSTATWRTRWDGSVRARAGVAVDRALLYVTGGVAFADFGFAQTIPAVSLSQTRVGWTLGAGVEYAVTPNWTVRGEYLYANYGSKSFIAPGLGASPPVSLQEHKFRLGVNYLFSTGPSAVVARY